MPLVADAACQTDLTARITSPFIDLTLIYSYISQFSVNGVSRTNESPIPASTVATDNTLHDPITLSITGTIGCVGCSEASDTSRIVDTLEQARRATVYTPNDFFTIVTNRVNRYSKMVLLSYSVDLIDTQLQTMTITTNFRAANIAGNVQSPSFELGGVF